jgi:hypothetical protein
MDDGSKSGRGAKISTNQFYIHDLQKLTHIFKDLFNVTSTLNRCGNEDQRVLYLSATTIPTFTNIIKPYLRPIMYYKIPPHKLQRPIQKITQSKNLQQYPSPKSLLPTSFYWAEHNQKHQLVIDFKKTLPLYAQSQDYYIHIKRLSYLDPKDLQQFQYIDTQVRAFDTQQWDLFEIQDTHPQNISQQRRLWAWRQKNKPFS